MQQSCWYQPIYEQAKMKIRAIQINQFTHNTFSKNDNTWEINLTSLSTKDCKRERKIKYSNIIRDLALKEVAI